MECPKCATNELAVIMDYEEAAMIGTDKTMTVAVCPICGYQEDDNSSDFEKYDPDDGEEWEE